MIARTRVRAGRQGGGGMADKKKEDFGTRVFNTLTTMAAGFIARRVVAFLWT